MELPGDPHPAPKKIREHFERLGVGAVRADFDAGRYQEADREAATAWLAVKDAQQATERFLEGIKWIVLGIVLGFLAVVVWLGRH